MKRILTLAGAAMLAATMATGAGAQDWRGRDDDSRDRNHDGIEGNARGGDRDGYDRDRNHDGIDGNARDGRYRGGRDPRHDGIDGNARYDDRYDRRYDGRYNRYDPYHDGIYGNARRWERRQHNGYTYNGQWFYGPPPAYYYNQPGYYPGYHAWRRGDRLPPYYRDSYGVVDYRGYGLRPPPRGYHYVQDDRGDLLLVAIATGIILSVILGN